MEWGYANREGTCVIELMDYTSRSPYTGELRLNDSAPPVWSITWVWTATQHRGRGYATELMEKVCAEADAGGVALLLQVAGDTPTVDNPCPDYRGLIRWYERFGFRVWDGANSMVRHPST